jgi:exopolyphosphatase/guanosine-5'-triphosphate,3'-diphosphate pyrophosphatase
MTRVAAVDCGTNTVRLLVADVDVAAGRLESLSRELRIVRLGQGVDRSGRLADEAVARLLGAVDEYAATIARHDVRAVRFVATSAVRDAANADDLAESIRSRLGVTPAVVSGEEEARLSYAGATRSLPETPTPLAVVDIGGGSTEVVVGEPPEVHGARSLDVGSVRLTERLMPSDPPTAAERRAAAALVDQQLDTLPSYGVRLADTAGVVGVAGTVTTIGMLLLGLRTWRRERVHHAGFDVDAVHDMVDRLLAMTVAERERLGVPAGRSDVIAAGALILGRVLRRSRASRLTVSDADILDGIAWSLAGE